MLLFKKRKVCVSLVILLGLWFINNMFKFLCLIKLSKFCCILFFKVLFKVFKGLFKSNRFLVVIKVFVKVICWVCLLES